MIRFAQVFGAYAGKTYELDQPLVRFGRQPTCDVAFHPDADIDASGNHAELRLEAEGYVLVDVGSRNGTFIGESQIQRVVLAEGDVVEFGRGGPRLRVEAIRLAVPGPASRADPAALTHPSTPAFVAAEGGTDPQSEAAHAGMGRDDSGLAAALDPVGSAPGLRSAMESSASSGGSSSRLGAADAQEARYGDRTVGMMIQRALDSARVQSAAGDSRSTAFVRAIAREATQDSSRKLVWVIVVLVVLLAIAVCTTGVALWMNLSADDHADEEQIGARIARENRGAIWLLAADVAGQSRRPVCTAFAVRPDLLATNAHCAVALERLQQDGASIVAVANENGDAVLPLLRVWRHPGYLDDAAGPTADVALIEVEGTCPQVVNVASPVQLDAIRVGQEIYVYGFPGDMAGIGQPVATITHGVVGRLMALVGEDVASGQARVIQHSAFTASGTSGSPIFARDGTVMGVNTGSFRATEELVVIEPGGRRTETVVADSGYKYGVRADLLLALLAGLPR